VVWAKATVEVWGEERACKLVEANSQKVEAEVVVAGWEAIGLGPAPAGNASVRIAESVYPIK